MFILSDTEGEAIERQEAFNHASCADAGCPGGSGESHAQQQQQQTYGGGKGRQGRQARQGGKGGKGSQGSSDEKADGDDQGQPRDDAGQWAQ